jgi:PBSX family phage terminase large subunit
MKRVSLPFGVPNSLQKRANAEFKAGKRIVLVLAGRQGGKSHYGARWLIAQTMDANAKHKLAAAVAPTYRMARVLQRKLEEVLKADLRLWKRIKHTKQPIPTYEFPNGWTIEVHSSDDPDALRGPSFAAVWYDEVAKGSEESFDILMPTLLSTAGRFLGTTTPRGKQNWIYRRIYLKSCPPGHPDHDPELYHEAYSTVRGSTWDNVENLSEDAVRQLEDQYGKGSQFGRQEIEGEFVSFEGLVYAWDEKNYWHPKKMPPLSEYTAIVGGIDFGWTDPAAAIVLGYLDGVWYVLDGVYETHLEPNDFANHIAALGSTYGVEAWYADSARPDSIADLKSRGIPVIPVVKPKIEDRIKEVAIFANNNRLKVSYRAPFVKDELQTYQYPEPNKLARDRERKPIDKYNHAMDAIGYAVWSMRWMWQNTAPYTIKRRRDRVEKDPDDHVSRQKKTDPLTIYGGPSGLIGS